MGDKIWQYNVRVVHILVLLPVHIPPKFWDAQEPSFEAYRFDGISWKIEKKNWANMYPPLSKVRPGEKKVRSERGGGGSALGYIFEGKYKNV